jgi:uncharacterized integral membrane protein
MAPEKKPVNWRAWFVGILIALVLIVALQNSQQVSVEVLTASFNAPLIVVILISVGVGAVVGYAAPVLLRHRRDERRSAATPPADRG